MVLNEANYRERIAALSLEDWKPLLVLIPEIRKTSNFIKVHKDERDDDVINLNPSYSESRVVHEFRQIVYDIPIIIDFNWAKWEEGKEIVSDASFDYDTIDIPTKCKVITALVRNDRFCSGRLAEAFESGLILKILESIKHQLNEIYG